jgi:hypothetical protein
LLTPFHQWMDRFQTCIDGGEEYIEWIFLWLNKFMFIWRGNRDAKGELWIPYRMNSARIESNKIWTNQIHKNEKKWNRMEYDSEKIVMQIFSMKCWNILK